MKRCDALVVGAGVAGSAAAIRLASAGERVVLVDRERGPTHKVCGEFLSGPAAAHMRELGLDPASVGAKKVSGLRVIDGSRVIEAGLPFEAWGLSRYRMDSALRERAEWAGAELRLGATVRHLEDARATLSDGEVLAARHIVLATGKHDLPGHRRRLARKKGMVGFKMHLRLSPSAAATLGDRIELHLFDGGYAGFQPLAEDVINISLVVDERTFAASGRCFDGVLATIAPKGSVMGHRLEAPATHWAKPLAVAGIPYGFRLWSRSEGPRWLWPIGDQAAVIPSFAGDGIAMAMASAEDAASAILSGSSPAEYRRLLRRRSSRQLIVAEALNSIIAMRGLRATTMAAVSAVPAMATVAARLTRSREAAGEIRPPACRRHPRA